MENRTLKTENLRLARVKYFDTAHNGAEITDKEVYAFLFTHDGEYANVFNPEDDLPVYDRSPYANTTKEGIDYGNKLFHVSGPVQDGPCYVVEPVSVTRLFEKDTITMEELRRYVMQSSQFFIDQIRLLEQEAGPKSVQRWKKIKDCIRKREEFNKYLASHGKKTVCLK